MKYREIPKEERSRLEAEVYRRSPRLRAIQFAAILLPLLFSPLFAAMVVESEDPLFERLAVRVLVALVLCAIIWLPFGRRKVRQEVERLKNA